MEHIRVSKVENCLNIHRGESCPGSLHITKHHLIFRHRDPPPQDTPEPGSSPVKRKPPKEIWVAYPIVAQAIRHSPCASAPAQIRLRNRDYSCVTLRFETDRECRDVFDSIKALAVVKEVDSLYAFAYKPQGLEKKQNGWTLYDPEKELRRMGLGSEDGSGWRITNINKNYTLCATYPAVLAIPAAISDTTYKHASSYRSKERLPALTYLHKRNKCTITRCAQPMAGIRGNRNPQDETLVRKIFESSQPLNWSNVPEYLSGSTPSPSGSTSNLNSTSTTPPNEGIAEKDKIYGAQQRNLIVDARPTVNAYAMSVTGLGTEDMEFYKHCSDPPCEKIYLGIDNIHVMRGCLDKVINAIKDSDISPFPPSREMLARSGWLKHIGILLQGTEKIVERIDTQCAHVLIHCSDGWDRTSQLSSLSQLCLDPYFRTIEGFMVLIEKDWASFGHQFQKRCGFLSHEKWFTEQNTYGAQPPDSETLPVDEGEEEKPSSGNPFASDAAAFGQALVGQARNFFSRSSTPPIDGSDENEIDRRMRAARSAEAKSLDTKPKEMSPVFQQFLDCTYQLLYQNPSRFEFNERFLRRLLFHLYSCQFGTFLLNSERDRKEKNIHSRTRSVWDYFVARRKLWVNEKYDPELDSEEKEKARSGPGPVIRPMPRSVRWWSECWGREDGEMNELPVTTTSTQPTTTLAAQELKFNDGSRAPSFNESRTSPSFNERANTATAAAVVGVVDQVRALGLGKTGGAAEEKVPKELEMM